MKLGAIYPQTELNGDPEALRSFGVTMEQLRYDYIVMYDHVVAAPHEDRRSAHGL
jgi:hypothetical protein